MSLLSWELKNDAILVWTMANWSVWMLSSWEMWPLLISVTLQRINMQRMQWFFADMLSSCKFATSLAGRGEMAVLNYCSEAFECVVTPSSSRSSWATRRPDSSLCWTRVLTGYPTRKGHLLVLKLKFNFYEFTWTLLHLYERVALPSYYWLITVFPWYYIIFW